MGSKGFPPTDRCPCSSGRTFAVCCEPKGVDATALRSDNVDAMHANGFDPALVYAYERTHLIVSPAHRTAGVLSPADLEEWDDAIAEYHELNAN